MRQSRFIPLALGLWLALLAGGAAAQAAMALRTEVLSHVKARFKVDAGQVQAEADELVAHLQPRWGEPNRTGTAVSPRLVWVVPAPGDNLGNCVRIDARKYNANTPGLAFKVLTGKCAMYAREGLRIQG